MNTLCPTNQQSAEQQKWSELVRGKALPLLCIPLRVYTEVLFIRKRGETSNHVKQNKAGSERKSCDPRHVSLNNECLKITPLIKGTENSAWLLQESSWKRGPYLQGVSAHLEGAINGDFS
ncbi:uncharacterized protein LOC143268351 [Peromyscus maniculatus bairdii]|uniref:uncharacterized protein LOC143268351 n=1 Tax=Peromyscus maniculatus bairdii TaxID=230844 RepID=UPI003FCFE3A6